MSQVLFDIPGPRARRRYLTYSALFSVVILGLAALVVKKLVETGSLTPQVFNDTFQNDNVRFLLEGFGATLEAAVIAIVTSIIFGALLAAGRLSDHRVIRWPSTLVVQLFRAIPVVMMILVVYYTAKQTVGILGSLVVGLTLYNGSVLAEVFRAGVNAVQKGQSEAAYALGMRKTQVMTLILMPQAVRFMLPAIVSQCVIVLKDTSLGYVIVYFEVLRKSKIVAQYVDNGAILVYATVALVFIIINYGLSKLATYLERKLSQRGEKAVDLSTVAATSA